jgi:hypothetical protein
MALELACVVGRGQDSADGVDGAPLMAEKTPDSGAPLRPLPMLFARARRLGYRPALPAALAGRSCPMPRPLRLVAATRSSASFRDNTPAIRTSRIRRADAFCIVLQASGRGRTRRPGRVSRIRA